MEMNTVQSASEEHSSARSTHSGEEEVQKKVDAQQVKKAHTCDQCDQSFQWKASLRNHMLIHKGIKNFVCQTCGRAFTEKSQLTKHIRTHSGEKPFLCQYCSESFPRSDLLKNHEFKHTGDSKFSCPICDRKTPTQALLKQHMKSHSQEKPFSCCHCGKSFKNKHRLATHERIHNDERPFKCSLCEKAFRVKYQLTQHVASIHTKTAKKYICDVPGCDKIYTKKESLKSHMMSGHKEEATYVCMICDKVFASKHNLQTHEKIHMNTRQHHNKAKKHQQKEVESDQYLQNVPKEEEIYLVENDTDVTMIENNNCAAYDGTIMIDGHPVPIITDDHGQKVAMVTDAEGNLVALVNEDGQKLSMMMDEEGQLVAVPTEEEENTTLTEQNRTIDTDIEVFHIKDQNSLTAANAKETFCDYTCVTGHNNYDTIYPNQFQAEVNINQELHHDETSTGEPIT